MRYRSRKERIFYSITWLRWILTFVVAIALGVNRNTIALFVFVLTALLGFFDNLLSRRFRSPLRSIIDFFADKFLVDITAVILTFKGVIPLWVTLIFVGRDLLTLIGGTFLVVKDLRREFKPTVLGKISFFFQVMSLIPPMLNGAVDWNVMGAALFLTILSGFYALFKSEFRLVKRKRVTEFDEFKLSKLLKLADLFTLFNVALGLVSVVFAISNNFKVAGILLLIAVVFDYLDGKIAKMLKQQNHFGKELDSLADTVSFGIAPAIFGFSLMQFSSQLQQFQINFGIIALTIFLFCGILRLAKYNIMDMRGVYQGMPITLNGVIIPVVYFFNVPIKLYPFIFLLLGVLMVSSLRVKKLF